MMADTSFIAFLLLNMNPAHLANLRQDGTKLV
jgi:hypothetical protein